MNDAPSPSSLTTQELLALASRAMDARAPLLEDREAMTRLFHGHTEGSTPLVIERFARTAVILDGRPAFEAQDELSLRLAELLQARLPWLEAIVLKRRRSESLEERHGQLIAGDLSRIATQVSENGIRYALGLTLHHDNTFFGDTRALRGWLHSEMKDRSVLNTFAYTGSLGVAARMGGASRVVQLDHNPTLLGLARRSCELNGLQVGRGELVTSDFFLHAARLRKQGTLFDCVIVDPPFFSQTQGGRVQLADNPTRQLDKVRPLVAHEGFLVAVNNALYLSGKDFLRSLEELGRDGCLSLEKTLPVPEDLVGMLPAQGTPWPAEPAPFNHPTKIALLRVKRKDGRRAS